MILSHAEEMRLVGDTKALVFFVFVDRQRPCFPHAALIGDVTDEKLWRCCSSDFHFSGRIESPGHK